MESSLKPVKMVSILLMVLMAIFLVSCGGGGGGGDREDKTGSDQDTLDTSFLELQNPGEYSGESTLKKNDDVYELAESEGITEDEDSNTVTLSNPSRSYEAGDVILGDENTRFAKKIVSVAEINGETVMQVEDASFEDAFYDGSLSFAVTPDWSNGQVSNEALLQKPFSAYFTPSRIQMSLDSDDISSNGSLNFDNTSLFQIFVEYDEQDDRYEIDWSKSSIMGQSLDDNGDGEGDITESVSQSEFDSGGEISATITEGRLSFVPTITGGYQILGGLNVTSQMDVLITFDATVEVFATGNVDFEFTRKLLPKIKVPVTIPALSLIHI